MNRTKTIRGIRVKSADEGIAEVVFATLGVKDKDGDVAFKSSFDDGAPVIVSAYQHGSWKGKLPVGKGVMRITDDEAIAELKFFLDTTHGHDTWITIKELGEDDLQEWSYSLHDVKQHRGELDGEKVNFLDHIRVKEISPVVEGAGIDTRVLTTKGRRKMLNSELVRALDDAARERWGSDTTWTWCRDFDLEAGFAVFGIYSDDEADRFVQVDFTVTGGDVELDDDETDVEMVTSYAPKSASFSEHARLVMAQVDGLTARASDVVAIRAEKGKTISEHSADLLKQLGDRVDAVRALIAAPDPTTHTGAELDPLLKARLVHVARTRGVTIP